MVVKCMDYCEVWDHLPANPAKSWANTQKGISPKLSYKIEIIYL